MRYLQGSKYGPVWYELNYYFPRFQMFVFFFDYADWKSAKKH